MRHTSGSEEGKAHLKKLESSGLLWFANRLLNEKWNYLVCACAAVHLGSKFRILGHDIVLLWDSGVSSPDVRDWTRWSSSGVALGGAWPLDCNFYSFACLFLLLIKQVCDLRASPFYSPDPKVFGVEIPRPPRPEGWEGPR